MAKKKKVEEDEVFHVEVITKARVGDEGQWEYLVKWAGYDSDADSWEPAENVEQCDRLLASFWNQVGTDDDDYPIGYEVAAREDWISKEKQYFARNFLKPPKSKGQSKQKEYQGKGKSKSNMLQKTESEEGESDSSNDVPLVKEIAKKKEKGYSDHENNNGDSTSDFGLPASTTMIHQISKDLPPALSKQVSSSSSSSSSSLIAPQKSGPLRTHHDQKTNPLVKSIDLPIHTVETGSSLTTKQRIAAGLPSVPSVSKSTTLPTKPLISLSFKKNKAPAPVSVQAKDPMQSAGDGVSPSSNTMMFGESGHDFSSFMDVDQNVNVGLIGPSSEESGSLEQNFESNKAAHIAFQHHEDTIADEFLKTVNLPELYAPLESESNIIPSNVTHSNEPIKSSVMTKIPKKWKWSGDLFISNSEYMTKLLGHVTIKDSTGSSDSSHISIFLSPSIDSLQISKLYSISELSSIFRACGKTQYIGNLESTEAKDEASVQGLTSHMIHHRQVAVIPLLLDQSEVAMLVIFPAIFSGLIQFLQVPDHYLSNTSLLVVLLPLVLSFHKSSNFSGWKPIKTLQDVSRSSFCLKRPLLAQAISFLQFPKSLLDFLDSSGSNKSYCIWSSHSDLGHSLETTLLQTILQSTKANLARLEEDVRVVFIHIGALASIQTMPGLVVKRVKFPETQFFTYGSHSSVDSRRWGFHEIFPVGGIVTFTATAIMEDLVGCCHLMMQLSEHPLWECYIVPEVLGACSLLSNEEGNDKMQSPSFLDPILNLIDSGQVCIGHMGHQGPSWLSQLLRYSSHTKYQLLDECSECMKTLLDPPNIQAAQLAGLTNQALTRDFANVQLQPVFMDNYRRFVVIRAASEAIPAEKDGIEWCPLASFEFKDDFF